MDRRETTTDCISRQEVLRTLHDWVYEGEYKEIADLIESLPPIEPPKKVIAQIKVDTEEIIEQIKEEYEIKDRPVCEDAISRTDTLKALCAECDVKCEDGIDKKSYCTEYAVVKGMPPVEPRDKDAISREGLLKSWEELSPRGRTEFDQVIMTIPTLPQVEPKRPKRTETMIVDGEPTEIDPLSYEVGYTHGQTAPIERTGEWIVYPLKDEGRVELECPECGYALIRAADRRPHFCENCGAKMKGKDDEC